jgi:hypothetical protein
VTALGLLTGLLDAGTFRPWDTALGRAVHDELRFLTRQDDTARMTARLRRYRSLGRARGGPPAGRIMGW